MTGGNVVGQASRIDAAAIRTGELLKVRTDLEDAQSHVSGAWAADTDTRLTAVVYGLEALLRATSTLTLLAERMEDEHRQDRQQIAFLKGRVNLAEVMA